MIAASTAYEPSQWSGFFSVEASASAALTGLLFVALSINLSRIIASSFLIARAAKSLSTLAAVLLLSTFGLVPGQSRLALGVEFIVLGILTWSAITTSERKSSRNNPYTGPVQKMLYAILAQGSSLPMLISGVSLIALRGGGLYWFVAGAVISVFSALIDSWVLLIEIQR